MEKKQVKYDTKIDDRILYRLTGLRFGHAYQACRYALASVLRHADAVVPPNNSEDVSIRYYNHLAKVRLARITALSEAGWSRARNKNWLYYVNCPPASATLESRDGCSYKYRYCCQTAFCPFCWCRSYVLDVYDRLFYAYYGFENGNKPPELERPMRNPFDLIEIVDTYRINRDVVTNPGLILETNYGGSKGRRKVLDTLSGVEGAFQLVVVEPSPKRSKEKEQAVVTLTQRLLVLSLPDACEVPALSDETENVKMVRTVKKHDVISPEVLAGAIGRVSQYPRQMLHGNVKETVALLQFLNAYGRPNESGRRSGFRMSNYYGILRNRTQRERTARYRHL